MDTGLTVLLIVNLSIEKLANGCSAKTNCVKNNSIELRTQYLNTTFVQNPVQQS